MCVLACPGTAFDPFRRRDSIGRSPPRATTRATSKTRAISDDEVFEINSDMETGAEAKVAKPKRLRENSGEGLEELQKMFKKLRDTVKELVKVVAQNTNTKIELKKGIRVADGLVSEVNRKWDQLTSRPERPKRLKTCDKLPNAMDPEYRKPETKECGTQAEGETIMREVEIATETEVTRIRTILGQKQGWKGCESLLDTEWNEDCYVQTTQANVIEGLMATEGDLALILDPRKIEEGRILDSVKKRYPELEGILTEMPTRVEYITRKTETVTSKGSGGTRSTTLYVLPLYTGVTGGETETERTYRLLEELTQKIREKNINQVQIARLPNIDGKYIRKCMEAIITETEVKAEILVEERQKRRRARSTRGLVNTGRPPLTGGAKIIVKSEGRSYTEVLRDMKTKVDIAKIDVKIDRVGKTARGDLLLEVGGVAENAKRLKAAIERDSDDGTRVELVREASTIYISGIEPDATIEDVTKAIQDKATEKNWGEMKVSPLRPGIRGTLNASVVLHKQLARKIVDEGSIKIGWTRCKVRNRINLVRCYRCLNFGHRTNECKGKDRTGRCLNCGEPGHVSRECKNGSSCTHCNIPGHRADQMSCPNF